MSAEHVLTFEGLPQGNVIVVLDEHALAPANLPLAVQSEGVLVGRRATINWTADVDEPTDNPAANRVDVPITTGTIGGESSRGEMSLQGNATPTALTLQNTWYPIAGSWQAGVAESVTVDMVNGDLTAGIAGDFVAIATVTHINSGVGTHGLELAFAVNGDVVTKTIVPHRSTGGSGVDTTSISGVLTLAVDDVVDVRVRCTDDAGDSLLFTYANVAIVLGAGSAEGAPAAHAASHAAAGSDPLTLTAAQISDAGDLATLDAVGTSQITDASVTYAKIQDVAAASRLLGRGSAAGAGDVEEISIGSGLSMSGTTLSATGGGGGSGDVVGPASSTDNAVARFDLITGKLLQNSAVTIDDSGNIATSGTVDGRDVSTDGGTLDSHVANTSNPHSVTIGQVSSKLATIDALTWAADRVAYFTGAAASALATLTAFGRSIIALADAAAARALFDVEPGVDVQAYDAELAAIAGLTSAADSAPYFTGSGTAALATLTAAGRALIDDADASAQRTTLGLGALATLATVGTTQIDDDAITVAKIADGTDGELITWGADGEATTVAVGTAGHVLTSNGAGAAPTFQAVAGGSAASEGTAGIAELATQSETDAGTDDARIVTPLKLYTRAHKADATEAAAPAAGYIRQYAHMHAGRTVLECIDEYGIRTSDQASLWERDWGMWVAQSGNLASATMPLNTTGTSTTPNPTTTSARTRQRRASLTQTAGLDATCQWRNATQSGITRVSGFFAVWRFATGSVLDGQRCFIGYLQSTSNIGTSLEPTSLTNCVGIGHDDAGGACNYSIIHNDSSGTATTIPLGADFPKSDTAVYELMLFAPPDDTAIYYRVTNLETGDVADGSIATDLPSTTGNTQSHVWINSGTTNGAPIIELALHYFETHRNGDLV